MFLWFHFTDDFCIMSETDSHDTAYPEQHLPWWNVFVDSLKKHQFSSIKWSKTTFFSLSIVHSFQAKKTNQKVAFRESSAIPLDILVSRYCKVLTLFCIELTIILHTDLAQCTVTVVTEEGIILHCVLIWQWMSHCCFICQFHSLINTSALTGWLLSLVWCVQQLTNVSDLVLKM